MADYVKWVILVVVTLAVLMLSGSISYSICVRGSANIIFSAGPSVEQTASSSMSIGFEVGGYRVRIMK